MARDSQAALVALNRFGLGARGGASGDFLNAASDPRGFVKAELARPNGVLLEVPGLQSTPALGKAVFDYQFEIQQARDAAAKSAPAPATEGQSPPDAKAQRRNLSLNSIAMDMAPREPSREQPAKPPENRDAAMAPAEAMRPNAPKPPPAPLNIIQKTFRAEALARLQRAVIADCGFVERLVVFWSNHFCISANKGGPARMWAGSFEREAIRPYVLGRFGDMLKAVEQHPAMLFFLDNQQSLGPDSRAGKNRNRGLNENLAREILELHTLGVGGGYSQDDVTSLANIITGWTYAGRLGQLGAPGTFVFNANAHQPGAQRVMGKIYDASDVSAGRGGAGGHRAPSVDREIHRGQIRASLRGRRSAAGPGGAARRCLCENRRRPQGAGDWRWWIPTTPGRRRFQKCARLTNSWWRRAGCWRRSRTIPAAISAPSTRWASRYGRPPGRTVFPIATRPGRRRKASSCGSIYQRRSPRGSPTASIRATCSNSLPRMRHHQRRGGPSSARNRGSRRWRCC